MPVLLSPFLSRLQEGTEPSGERARRLAQVPGGRQLGVGAPATSSRVGPGSQSGPPSAWRPSRSAHKVSAPRREFA